MHFPEQDIKASYETKAVQLAMSQTSHCFHLVFLFIIWLLYKKEWIVGAIKRSILTESRYYRWGSRLAVAYDWLTAL